MRPPIRYIANGLLLSGVLLSVQTPGLGSARSLPEGATVPAQRVRAADESTADVRPALPPPALTNDVSSVRFDDGQEKAVPGSVRTLRSVERMLAAHPEVRALRIEGHADDIGDPCFNLSLSKRRVRGVVRWLISNGVARERLELLACGRRYADPGSRTQATRAQNRRVELSVSDPAQGGVLRDRCDPIELE